MIRGRLEMCPRGDERPESVREIGRVYIANVGGTTTRGDYEVAVCRRGTDRVPQPINPIGPKPTRAARIEGYPRTAYNTWRLIARALLAAFPEERRLACEPSPGDSATDEHREPDDNEATELGREIAPTATPADAFTIGHAAWARGARPRGF